MNVMFICTGNICRSAMAHHMFEKITKQYNKDIKVFSCGTYAQNGDVPTDEAIEVMQKYEVDLRPHRATNIENSNIYDMDLILCATMDHKKMVNQMYPELKDKVYTMKEYAKYPKFNLNISDPWGYGIDVYKNCAKEIKECLDKIIKRL